ncbi:MAG: hypothetical protein ISR76_03805 [Planctomycetes bacterium]|nr:hypothetical protein [Planctomycetota bacterium]MBL7008097.1 hypothetical protein [Planctomycetota bacterium]
MTGEFNQQQRAKGNGRRKGPWSQAEIERLKLRYGLRSDAQISRELNRSVESVRRMAKRVFAGDLRLGPWSAAEVQALKNYIGAARIDVIAQILRRSPTEIRRKVEELQGKTTAGPWTSADIQQLKRLYGTRSNADLAVILGRPEVDIVSKSAEICLAKDKGFQRRRGSSQATRMPRWTSEEVELLKQLYPELSNLEIARRLNRSQKSVVSKAHDLGLKKTPRRLRDMGRENVSLRYRKQDDPRSGQRDSEV